MRPQYEPIRVKLMLDSGAFSAWKMNQPIDLRDYIDFLKQTDGLLESYVALDVIPGQGGRMVRTYEAVEASAKASYRNLEIMRDAGLRPIPVFHQGEDFKWLNRLVEDGEEYIGISP